MLTLLIKQWHRCELSDLLSILVVCGQCSLAMSLVLAAFMHIVHEAVASPRINHSLALSSESVRVLYIDRTLSLCAFRKLECLLRASHATHFCSLVPL